MYNAITDVPGIKVGHYTDEKGGTGCTVILCEEGAVAGVDVRGSAPGTRETDPLGLTHLVSFIHAVMLSGGSAFGLDAAGGAMRYLEERGIGHGVGAVKVPIVPTAILFDLLVGDSHIRPGIPEGYQACLSAQSGPVAEGTVGAGTGATVGKIMGPEYGTKGGLGTASESFGDGFIVGAIVAVNAMGDVVDPETGKIIAGPRNEKGDGFLSTGDLMRHGVRNRPEILANTTIAVVATNAYINRPQATKIAQMAHDGLARAIRPVHTMFDGDTVFAISTEKDRQKRADVTLLGIVAADVLAKAVVRAITQAKGLHGVPAAKDLTVNRLPITGPAGAKERGA